MRTILDLLPQNPEVNQVMVDFEKAMWNYLREVLPDVTVKGCVFHWTQALWALWRKVSKKIITVIIIITITIITIIRILQEGVIHRGPRWISNL